MALRMETLEKQGVPDHVSIEDFLDVSPGFFWCLDGSMRFSFVSEGVLGISGLEAAEHLGGGFDVLGYAWAGGDDPLEAREPFQDRLVWLGDWRTRLDVSGGQAGFPTGYRVRRFCRDRDFGGRARYGRSS